MEKLKQSHHTSHDTKLKGTWEGGSYFAGTCESTEMHIQIKNVYVKIICACVYASVEVTKGLFPQAFVLCLC